MSTKLWTSSIENLKDSCLWKYKQYIENNYKIYFKNYDDFHNWSVENLEIFWKSIIYYFDLQYDNQYTKVLDWNELDDTFINVKWFEGINLSYAEHIFKQRDTHIPAIKFSNELSEYVELSWSDLEKKVSKIQQFLLTKSIKRGDRIVGILNNTIDTIAVFLAVNSLGAIWSCCSPDFGDKSILDRFSQIEPKMLFIQSEYQYNGKQFRKSTIISLLQNSIPSLENIVDLNSSQWNEILESIVPDKLIFTRVPFSSPIWILYSSGTTGIPKAITHSMGGILIEHYKALALHQNVKKGDNFLWYTTTGWMMWNYALSSLLCGATLCLYDGAINHSNDYTFWNFIREAKVDHLGAGASYFSSLSNIPVRDYFPKVIASTGSPLSPETFCYLQDNFPDVHIISLSGGTDVCSAFLSGCTMLPVFAGQIQCKTLGSAIAAFNEEGKSISNAVGELVVTKPMPSMPLLFWNDQGNYKYYDSYFTKYQGIWSHGDWIKIILKEGIIIYGRSDATLNRGGIRIGTAEIYNTVNVIDSIIDSLVITANNNKGVSNMYLFVKLKESQILDEELKFLINSNLRKENSPRHIPDYIYQVEDIPYTLSGKKLEIPIKKIFEGNSIEESVSKDIVRNPFSLHNFYSIYESIRSE